MKEFRLKHKVYKWYDLLCIPFSCSPLSTTAIGVQKLLTALAAVLQVIVLANFVDSVNENLNSAGTLSDSIVWFVLLVICVGWRRISFMVGRIFFVKLKILANVQLGKALTDKRSKLQYYLIEDEESWNLINRVCKDPDDQVRLMAQRTFNLMLYIIRIVGVLYIVFVNVWWIGILTGISCVPLLYLSLKSGENNYNRKKEVAHYERRYQYYGDVLSGRDAVNERALFNYTEKMNHQWFDLYEEARKIKLRANIQMTASIRLGSAAMTVLSSAIVVVLIVPTARGDISSGMFVALATGMYDLVNMVGVELVKAVSQLSQCREYLRDLSVFAAMDKVKDVDSLPEINEFDLRDVEFRNVSFKYPGTTRDILKNISFKIENNCHYAFVGTNGAGKTTITKLMTGLYDQYKGEILINGKELRSYSQAQIKSFFSGVYQDFAKYSISVKDNVLVGAVHQMEQPDKEQYVNTALKRVGLYEKVMSLPAGIETPLGKISEGGVDFSGGQWQKLAMARAIINPAPILILDEPTAALDPVSESDMYEEFGQIGQGKTTIFISHRLGSTKLADKIFVLDSGSIVETGSHEELLHKNKLYANMYESQRGWYN